MAGGLLSPFVIWHIFFWLTENVKYKLYTSGNTVKGAAFFHLISFLIIERNVDNFFLKTFDIF